MSGIDLTRWIAPLAAFGLGALATPAAAHVTPSVDDNNRYLKVTPLGDRVRLAYTVFFGDNPGRGERQTMDADKNGTLSEDEAHAFGTNLAAQVAAAIDLDLDGKGQHVVWAEVDVGMGTPQVAAGSFSVDLVAYPCLVDPPRGPHKMKLHDRFRVLRPGTTEVKVEDSPGVTIDRARVGQRDDASYDYNFVGPGGPLEDDGLDLAFTVGSNAPLGGDGCTTASESSPSKKPGGGKASWIVLGSVVAAVGLGGAALLVARRRRAPTKKPKRRR